VQQFLVGGSFVTIPYRILARLITSKDLLFRRGFFILDMLDLHQKIKTLIQWLSFRFVPLIITPMDKRLKTGSFQRQKKIKD
jgi:hypothetical protein